MIKTNKTQLLIGLIFVLMAFICALTVLYFMGNSSQSQRQKIDTLEAKLSNLINEKAEGQMAKADYERAKQTPITIQDFVEKTEGLYSQEELNRREGILWIDRKSSTGMITLGAIHGIGKGSYLDIFDGDTQIATVRVDLPLDIISYVVPIDKTWDELSGNYYRAVIRK